MRGYEALSLFGEWNWFLLGPVLYFVTASIALLLGVAFLPARLRAWGMVCGCALEVLLFAVPMAYQGVFRGQVRQPPDYVVKTFSPRIRSLADYSEYISAGMTKNRSGSSSVRWTSWLSTNDNQAWAHDSRALLGMASKPLLPRFQAYIDTFAQGAPYHLTWKTSGLTYTALQNMNVGYVMIPRNIALKAATPVEQTERAHLFELPAPLPYVYTQDHVVSLDAKSQLDRLCETDLRGAAYVNPNDA